jgi:hypothetical protein
LTVVTAEGATAASPFPAFPVASLRRHVAVTGRMNLQQVSNEPVTAQEQKPIRLDILNI